MLKDKLERANQQIKLLAVISLFTQYTIITVTTNNTKAVLQIVHEDVSIKNDQLEILHANLRQNPVWRDCMNTINLPIHQQDITQNDSQQRPLHSMIKSRSFQNMDIHHKQKKSKSARSRSLSPSRKHSAPTNSSENCIQSNENRDKLLISSHLFRYISIPHHSQKLPLIVCHNSIQTINEDTYCYLNSMSEDTQISLCTFIPYQDLLHLAQTNKLWNSIITDDLVWKMCFRVKFCLLPLPHTAHNLQKYTQMAFG